MKIVAKKRQRIERIDGRQWLWCLLTDDRSEIGSQPSPQAIARIRDRVMAQVKTPLRVAA